jgi:hypothetical protein
MTMPPLDREALSWTTEKRKDMSQRLGHRTTRTIQHLMKLWHPGALLFDGNEKEAKSLTLHLVSRVLLCRASRK